MTLKNKKVLVMGMRTSGVSACNLLKKLGAKAICYDDSLNLSKNYYKNFKGQPIEDILEDLSLIIISPAIPNDHNILMQAKSKKIPIISELEFGCKYLTAPIICITGTNGKTTTVCMVEKILSNAGFTVKAMGNIGYPVSQAVADNLLLDFAIVEASSFQLENVVSLHAYISVILNVAYDHMERYKTFEDYVQAKANILHNQTNLDYAILNVDNEIVRCLLDKPKANLIEISIQQPNSKVYIESGYYYFGDTKLCNIKDSKAKGLHNRYNFLVALNIGAILGCKKEHMLNLIKNYTTLPHRVEYVTTLNGKSFYNDSKSTNTHACNYAISCLDGPIGLIMGGSDKNEDYYNFFCNIDKKVRYITVTGSNAEKILTAALKMGFDNIVKKNTLYECVEVLANLSGISNVLFSPCAASFDRYENYAKRGEVFKGIVYEINF